MFRSGSLGTDRKRSQVVIYTIYNMWKEQMPTPTTSLTQEDIIHYETAYGQVHLNYLDLHPFPD